VYTFGEKAYGPFLRCFHIIADDLAHYSLEKNRQQKDRPYEINGITYRQY